MLPRRECPRCAAPQLLDARTCADCGAELPLVGIPVDHEIQLLRRWLSFIAIGTLIVAVVVWDHYRTPMWEVPGMTPEALATPYLVATTALALLWFAAPRFPLLVSVATLILFVATWGATYLLDRKSGLAVGPAMWIRLVFLFIVVQAVIAGYHARQRQRQAKEKR